MRTHKQIIAWQFARDLCLGIHQWADRHRIADGSAVETTELLELLQELGEDTAELISLSRDTQALTLRLMQ